MKWSETKQQMEQKQKTNKRTSGSEQGMANGEDVPQLKRKPQTIADIRMKGS